MQPSIIFSETPNINVIGVKKILSIVVLSQLTESLEYGNAHTATVISNMLW